MHTVSGFIEQVIHGRNQKYSVPFNDYTVPHDRAKSTQQNRVVVLTTDWLQSS